MNRLPKPLLYFSIGCLWLLGFSLWHPASMDVWIAEMTPVLSIIHFNLVDHKPLYIQYPVLLDDVRLVNHAYHRC
jgi:hypothetical protein